MNYLHLLLLLTLPVLCTTQAEYADDPSYRRDLPFVDLAKYDGYNAEEHFVTTKDGYILGTFRIPPRENCAKNKGVVMYMHGLYLSSDDCIVPGRRKAHCYIYSDNCYDVWVPNVRGNVYSRNHTHYDPDKDPSFWDFSFDEMALCDLPAAIDYILITTGSTQISYVAHSQGVTMLLILCAKIPEYNSKIKVGFGLSATAWCNHAPFFMLQFQGVLAPILTQLHGLLAVEIFARGGLVQKTVELLCGISNLTYPICAYCIFALFGYDEYQITSDVLPVIVGHTPSGTSVRNFNRWGQVVQNGFTEYDHGVIKNLMVYGQKNPPEYDLSKVIMKWVMFASVNDCVADVTDVKKLVSKLPNASICVLSDDKFSHLAFVYGRGIPKYITPIVLSTIETGCYECT